MLLLGLDIGSSSIKANIVDAENGKSIASAHYPPQEMEILSPETGWAEQNPQEWFKNIRMAIQLLNEKTNDNLKDIKGIGISYQMHGLVCLDKFGEPIRNAIIWCDSRAVDIGNKAFQDLGELYCLNNYLNSPGNFTASKLCWVQQYEPENYRRIYKVMLPGDYIAYQLTGEINTTESGLSEGIFWDFSNNKLSQKLLDYYNISSNLLPDTVPTFSIQGYVQKEVASELGIREGIPVAYRAGDQPNNAFSLNVLDPGDIAASAGTSGVLYAVSNTKSTDRKSRINNFLHINDTPQNPRIGQLMCINGTGIANAWIRNICNPRDYSYDIMNKMAAKISPGSDGINILPFGNGAERILESKLIGCSFHGISFKHNQHHLFRAIQEGIAYSFKLGLNILEETGTIPKSIKAGNGNLFQSRLFCEILATITGLRIEKYNTDGAIGAAVGAAMGIGYYKSLKECNTALEKVDEIYPLQKLDNIYSELYNNWQSILFTELNKLS